MDKLYNNIDYTITNNITFVNKIINIDTFNYILEIDTNYTSLNLKTFLLAYKTDSINSIKINIKPDYKYKIIDNNNNYKYEYFKNISLNNKLIKIILEYSNKYNNFYIKELIVFDTENKNNKLNCNINKKYNINKNTLISKIINIL